MRVLLKVLFKFLCLIICLMTFLNTKIYADNLPIICRSVVPHPLNVCIEVEKLEPSKIEFKQCVKRLLAMTLIEYHELYDVCNGGILMELTEYSLEDFKRKEHKCQVKKENEGFLKGTQKCRLEELYDFSEYMIKFEADYMKDKSYWRWIIFKFTGLNLF